MRIIKLTPQELDSHHWKASTYKGEIIVRAKDVRSARMEANSTFGIAVLVVPGEETATFPWSLSTLVIAEDITETGLFNVDGPQKVLSPEVDEEFLTDEV